MKKLISVIALMTSCASPIMAEENLPPVLPSYAQPVATGDCIDKESGAEGQCILFMNMKDSTPLGWLQFYQNGEPMFLRETYMDRYETVWVNPDFNDSY